MAASGEDYIPEGTPEPHLLENRIWVDGCFDFFHHGELDRL